MTDENKLTEKDDKLIDLADSVVKHIVSQINETYEDFRDRNEAYSFITLALFTHLRTILNVGTEYKLFLDFFLKSSDEMYNDKMKRKGDDVKKSIEEDEKRGGVIR